MFGRRNSDVQNAKFYRPPVTVDEVRSGYLFKSPPSYILSKSLKSWKRRYFVLSKAGGNNYELKYFKDETKKDKIVGEINLYEISLLFLHPETHPSWEWIHRNLKCSPSCVLYLRVPDRDYFLIGENSGEMDSWFKAIFEALNSCSSPRVTLEENKKPRSASEPTHVQKFGGNPKETDDHSPSSSIARRSAPESFNILYSHYDYPRSYKAAALPNSPKSEDEDDEEEEQMDVKEVKKDISEETDSSCYMDMGKVMEIARGTPNEGDARLYTELISGDVNYENVFLNSSGNGNSSGLNSQIPPESNTFIPMEICVSQEGLRNGVIFSEEAGKPCVSDCSTIQFSNVFHKGDQILAINDLLTYNLEEVHTYIRRLSKDYVKLTVLRQLGSRPLSECSM
ncbi:pleckstrin homology domain-containing family S member 1-like isoform X2 [Brachyhypopomus gauderio]